MTGIGFRRCPKCKGYMTPYLITTGRTYYKCPSCGYDSANEVYTWTNKTEVADMRSEKEYLDKTFQGHDGGEWFDITDMMTKESKE